MQDAWENMALGCLLTSFRKALAWGATAVSLGTLWNRFQGWGAQVRQTEIEAVAYHSQGDYSRGSSLYPFALVMIDGIWMRKAGSRGTTRKKSSHFEIKSARLAFGIGDDGKWEWTSPVLYADTCGAEAFLKRCRDYFNAVYGLHLVPHILVVSDAASWIKKFKDFYPGRAVHQLDWWHLWKKVYTLHFFGKEVYREAWELLTVERLEESLALIRQKKGELESFMVMAQGRDAGQREQFEVFQKRERKWLERRLGEIDDLLSYIENNRDCIYGVKELPKEIPAQAWVFGSGPEEKLQGTLLGYRMKKQGKSWSSPGAYHMSGLLAQWYNGPECRAVLERLCAEALEWERENERLEEENRWVFECADVTTKESFSSFNASLPILDRGLKRNGMFSLLKNIRNGSSIAA